MKAYEHLAALGEEIHDLDQDIWDQILPMALTRDHQGTVDALVQRYNALHQADQALVTNREDLFYAQRVLEKLQKNILSGELLELIQDQSSYTVAGVTADGTAYEVAFDPSKLTDLGDLNFDLSLGSGNQSVLESLAVNPLALRFAQSGALPAALTVRIPVDLADGVYGLYAFDGEAQRATLVQKVTVQGGVATFTLEQGGEYFLSTGLTGGTADGNISTGDSLPLGGLALLALFSAGAALILRRRVR